ncbi:DUF6252 family protein [Flavobacterium sp. Fl-77]|uniref:DUF6252 family protein n=1 Tax=Flavobacterium flavipigmentatum TaxID=2893884 RepID=A0AAJ2SEE3_9FLAO|nr:MULTISPECIES: DUF6252 family protein [unclassified Flavobacterium]MDX6181208.1 DUF6252 family protein [Flavobacterium sp. Fl-33]MDX6184809.1 DUF6252 family protein [Flavobacterium sp. Fl-77]UFH39906.1 DUF6252 family protein [Flavobacterium sp. F-70]
MKKYLLLLSLVILSSSCTEEIKFNNPAFQTLKNNVFWRAQNYNAFLNEDGGLIIVGQLGYEKVTLRSTSTNEKTYMLGLNNFSTASYSNSLQGQLADFSTGVNKGSGQIVITEYDSEANTVSGTFRFSAINADNEEVDLSTINFTEGVFYKIPLTFSSLEK